MKGRVVSNTGPMIALAMINRLDLLQSIFEETLIPEAVHNEIMEGGKAGAGVQDYLRASWILRRPLSNPTDALLQSALGKGEAAVIQLALESGADYTLLDERKARKIARSVYGLQLTGSAGILLEARRRGLVENVGDELHRMRDRGYWIHENIISAAMRTAGESEGL